MAFCFPVTLMFSVNIRMAGRSLYKTGLVDIDFLVRRAFKHHCIVRVPASRAVKGHDRSWAFFVYIILYPIFPHAVPIIGTFRLNVLLYKLDESSA